jgi:acyl CoA:acetate/3-ketoacid CoA transferase beta subunit
VDTIVTELCLIDVTAGGLVIRELREGITVEQVQRLTEARLVVEGMIGKMEF